MIVFTVLGILLCFKGVLKALKHDDSWFLYMLAGLLSSVIGMAFI